MPEKDTGETPTETEGQEPEVIAVTPGTADVNAQLEAMQAALKKANHEAASRRKELEKYQQADVVRKEAEMSELEKAQAKLVEMTTALVTANQERTTATIRQSIEREAVKQNFHDPSDTWRFLDTDAVTLTDGGKVEGVEAALKALAKTRAYLIKSATIPDIDATKHSTTKTPDADNQAIYRRYGVHPPKK